MIILTDFAFHYSLPPCPGLRALVFSVEALSRAPSHWPVGSLPTPLAPALVLFFPVAQTRGVGALPFAVLYIPFLVS